MDCPGCGFHMVAQGWSCPRCRKEIIQQDIDWSGAALRVYLAGPYESRDFLRDKIAPELERAGCVVVSSWLQEQGPEMEDLSLDLNDGLLRSDRVPLAREIAGRDFCEVKSCDVVVRFGGPGGRGGRMVEWGMGAALGRRLIVCGRRETIFDWMKGVELAENLAELVRMLEVGDGRHAG